MEMFTVGGWVRDQILGVPSKDIDFTVVLDNGDLFKIEKAFYGRPTSFDYMVSELKSMGFKIFLETPEYLTVRAQFPKFPEKKFTTPFVVEANRGKTADFVLARKESNYTDGRRPDEVVPGTLEDDLARRDFTMNAIAKDADGSLIDPFNGVEDIYARVIRAVGDPFERLSEDALRAVRAVRFSVTKDFDIDMDLRFAMQTEAVLNAIVNKISDERIKDELCKMFRFDTVASLRALQQFPLLTNAMFAGSVSLDATMKQRGRG